jgi:hypothetical protein
MKIDIETAVESLWQALEWEPLNSAEMFDQVAARLHRNPRLRDLPIAQLDLALADARREFEHDVSEFEWRLVRAFKDALGLTEEDAAA